jgi:hypothetical protein
MSMAWENGQRVPSFDPRDVEPEDDAPVQSLSSPALVMARRLIGFMLADPCPALGIECMALVTGIGYEGAARASIARRHKVTRAAVSKRCVELSESLGLPPTRAMRPEKCRVRCRNARMREMMEA